MRAVILVQRMLRPGGSFVALWNPRMIELNPLLVEIEQESTRLNLAVNAFPRDARARAVQQISGIRGAQDRRSGGN